MILKIMMLHSWKFIFDFVHEWEWYPPGAVYCEWLRIFLKFNGVWHAIHDMSFMQPAQVVIFLWSDSLKRFICYCYLMRFFIPHVRRVNASLKKPVIANSRRKGKQNFWLRKNVQSHQIVVRLLPNLSEHCMMLHCFFCHSLCNFSSLPWPKGWFQLYIMDLLCVLCIMDIKSHTASTLEQTRRMYNICSCDNCSGDNTYVKHNPNPSPNLNPYPTPNQKPNHYPHSNTLLPEISW